MPRLPDQARVTSITREVVGTCRVSICCDGHACGPHGACSFATVARAS